VTAANAVTGGQITDSIVIFDRKDNKYLTINMKIKKIAETMTNTHFCVPSDPTASTCSNSFDLELLFTITQPDRNEAIKMKIDCDNKIGSFESREIESGTGARTQYNLLEWSTEDMNSARFEEHELGIEGSSVKVSVSKLEKLGTSTDFWARTVNFGFDGSGSYGSTSEMHRISSYIASGNEHLQDGTPSAFFSNSATPVQTARASASLYNLTAGSPTSCMATSTSDLFTANAKASCNLPFNSVTPVTSQGLDLKLDEFSDLSTGVTAVPASSIKGVFTIP
jgi:hypothetical protein